MLKEFKDFINKGDIVSIAVGLVMALTFKAVIDAIIEGVIGPIVAAVAGKTDFSSIGFGIGDAFLSVGLVLEALVNFVIVAWILFLIVKAYNKVKADEAAAGPTDNDLLVEIRDALKAR